MLSTTITKSSTVTITISKTKTKYINNNNKDQNQIMISSLQKLFLCLHSMLTIYIKQSMLPKYVNKGKYAVNTGMFKAKYVYEGNYVNTGIFEAKCVNIGKYLKKDWNI